MKETANTLKCDIIFMSGLTPDTFRDYGEEFCTIKTDKGTETLSLDSALENGDLIRHRSAVASLTVYQEGAAVTISRADLLEIVRAFKEIESRETFAQWEG